MPYQDPGLQKDLRYEEKGTLLERLHRRNLEVESVTELRVAGLTFWRRRGLWFHWWEVQWGTEMQGPKLE